MPRAPAVSFTSVEDTPLDDLIRERAVYDNAIQLMIERGEKPHPLLYDALLAYDAVIVRRMREVQEQAA